VIKAVIFDIDGTLVDSVDLHARAWRDAFKRFGRDVPIEQVRRQIGKGGDQLMPVFFSKEELERFGKQIEEYRGELYKRVFLPRVKPFPKVRDLLWRIKTDGRRIVLASSAEKDEIQTYKKLARIEDLVNEQSSGDQVKTPSGYFRSGFKTIRRCDPARSNRSGRHALRRRSGWPVESEHHWSLKWRIYGSRVARCRLYRGISRPSTSA
jgi:phosphoglycolate phosphatase-like HAD superfamily hydrolase